jgi:hypothetical protein
LSPPLFFSIQGAFLVKRDQDKYRRAMKDLKDYEIYKEVMEATMIRMQQELELYAEEAMVSSLAC